MIVVEDATDHLLNLSPFEVKILLHMVISGKELGTTSGKLVFMLIFHRIKFNLSQFLVYSSKEDTEQNKTEMERRYLKDELKVCEIFDE